MTFTGKIRAYLVLVALLPPVLVMSVIYFHSEKQAAVSARQEAQRALARYGQFEQAYQGGLRATISEIAHSSHIRQAALSIRSGRTRNVDLSPVRTGVDFLEILDSSYTVLISSHRPGLNGETVLDDSDQSIPVEILALKTMEYDIKGPHAAFTFVSPIDEHYLLYTGRYVSDNYLAMVSGLIGAEIDLRLTDSANAFLSNLETGQLYTRDDQLMAVISGGEEAGFFLVARFADNPARPVFQSLLQVTGLVALVSILVAVALGMFITSRAKREIDNLVSATSRVAEGDFATPVMAYEEGEFSQLADSFSDMMVRLKTLQARLGTTEKIAAWEAMGRKIAHEVRNPLTPIAISIDDLHRSHRENQPDFGRILANTTATIKTEITRLNEMLDQFVNFARMKAPVITDVPPDRIAEKLKSLYGADVKSGRLAISNDSRRDSIAVDSEMIQQLLINLIKNSFETGDGTSVRVVIADCDEGVRISVEDDGAGFPDEVLKANFQPQLSTKEDGSGLGLVICQRIVFDHGGTIELYNRNEKGKGGAGVLVTLPV
jgi:signal transduction histidine kinase